MKELEKITLLEKELDKMNQRGQKFEKMKQLLCGLSGSRGRAAHSSAGETQRRLRADVASMRHW